MYLQVKNEQIKMILVNHGKLELSDELSTFHSSVFGLFLPIYSALLGPIPPLPLHGESIDLMKTIERLHRSIGLVWTLVSLEGFEDWIWDSRFEVSFHSALDSGPL